VLDSLFSISLARAKRKVLPRYQAVKASAYDPYTAIRAKIDSAREKFSEYKEFPCSLSLYNVDAPLVLLDDWTVVMGAMLGDLGYRFAKLGEAVGDFAYTFSKRGKMLNYKKLTPQNTTISAVLALDMFPLGRRRLEVDGRMKRKGLGKVWTGVNL
jgi:hypothetical protein